MTLLLPLLAFAFVTIVVAGGAFALMPGRSAVIQRRLGEVSGRPLTSGLESVSYDRMVDTLKKILVVTPSGVEALDEEAIRAFKSAQPFPNPPTALVDGNGLITFEFGFYFEINNEKRTAWKFNRSM